MKVATFAVKMNIKPRVCGYVFFSELFANFIHYKVTKKAFKAKYIRLLIF